MYKYEYLTVEEILPFHKRQISLHIYYVQTKFAYSPLGKAFEKHQKNRLLL